MPTIRIVHTTQYRYAKPVRFTTHRLMLRPRDSHDLVLTDAMLGITPPAAVARWAHDVFGNSIGYLDFGDTMADTLRIVSTLELRHFPPSAGLPETTIDPGAESYPFVYATAEMPDLESSLKRHHDDPDQVIDAWARTFVPENGSICTLDMLGNITRAIQNDFEYASRDEEGTNSPIATLQSRKGACRDLALLMMETVRALGLAARFVSGYLYDADLEQNPRVGEQMVGGGATHAWCSVYLPGAGWVEFDPTNGLIAGRNLLRVCSARTPEQAVPISGSFIGRPADFLGLDVDVAVTVQSRGPKENAPDGVSHDDAQPGQAGPAPEIAICKDQTA
jgi:transglutaminase-like putative cysteine protease